MSGPLRLRRLALAEFRSHPALELAFDGRPVALYGPNGSGKTNLLEAISMLSPGRGLRRAAPGELARAGGPGGWRVRALIERGAERTEAEVEADAEGRKRASLEGKAATQGALAELMPMLWLTPAMDRLWIEGPEGRRRFLDRAAFSLFPGHAAVAIDYDRAMRDRNRLLREDLREPEWLSALEARMARAGAALAAGRVAAARLLEAAQDAETGFPVAALEATGTLEAEIGFAEPEDEAALAPVAGRFREGLTRGRREDAAAGRALTGPHRSELAARYVAKDVEARVCSTGEQKALLISLVLANARALAEARGAAPLLLLDEVAAHLDDTRRGALFEALTALDAQAFLTGVGADAFAPFGERAQRFRLRETAEGSAVEAVAA